MDLPFRVSIFLLNSAVFQGPRGNDGAQHPSKTRIRMNIPVPFGPVHSIGTDDAPAISSSSKAVNYSMITHTDPPTPLLSGSFDDGTLDEQRPAQGCRTAGGSEKITGHCPMPGDNKPPT